jgi:archaellum component FlaG (FlaF/FlaG flagellin family)
MPAVIDEPGPNTYVASDGPDTFIFHVNDPGHNNVENFDTTEDRVILLGFHGNDASIPFFQLVYDEAEQIGVAMTYRGEDNPSVGSLTLLFEPGSPLTGGHWFILA